MMLNESLKKWIEENANDKIADFTRSLIPNIKYKVYGIRLPLLNKKAKEISAEIENIKNVAISVADALGDKLGKSVREAAEGLQKMDGVQNLYDTMKEAMGIKKGTQ